jgi:hypothetical protein
MFHVAMSRFLSSFLAGIFWSRSAERDRQIIFDSFKSKLQSDLNLEKLKKESAKKLIKRSKYFKNNKLETRDVLKDYENKVIYGVLHGGRITENSILESKKDKTDVEEAEYDYNLLKGDRIYDDFFFLLHISFDCNVARLFILTRKNTITTDSIFKNYLCTNLFKAKGYKKIIPSDFVPKEYREEVLKRVIVNDVFISNGQSILSESDNMEYEVEIRLRPKSKNTLNKVKASTLAFFKKSKVEISDSVSEDDNSAVKFKIKDPITGAEKTIAYTDKDSLIPKLVLKDDEILDENNEINVLKIKKLCLSYIRYSEDRNLGK